MGYDYWPDSFANKLSSKTVAKTDKNLAKRDIRKDWSGKIGLHGMKYIGLLTQNQLMEYC